MGLLSIEVECNKCEERYGILVERDERNEPQLCEKCEGGHAYRIWSVPHVSTEKTSASIPTATASGRFDALREQQAARKEVAKAKREYAKNPNSKNADEVKRARKEKRKVEGKI
jgi:hypothetical protein